MDDLVKRLRLAAKQDDEAWARERWALCADTIEALQEKVRVATEALGTIEAHEVDHAVTAAQNVEDMACVARVTLAQLRSPDHG